MKRSKFSIVLAAALLVCLLLPAAASAATVKLAYGDGALYLRSGPGKEYKDVGTVHNGDYIEVLDSGKTWAKVKTSDGKTGYIKRLYINDTDSKYAAGTSYYSDRYTVYTTANVNLRYGASTDTKPITTLNKGTKLTVLGKNGGFYLVVTGDGTQGYVSTSYVSKSGSSSSGSSSSGNSQSSWTKTVTASYVNVRAGGGMSYKVLRVLPRGTVVTVLNVGNYWTRIQYGSTVGWIKNSYLK